VRNGATAWSANFAVDAIVILLSLVSSGEWHPCSAVAMFPFCFSAFIWSGMSSWPRLRPPDRLRFGAGWGNSIATSLVPERLMTMMRSMLEYLLIKGTPLRGGHLSKSGRSSFEAKARRKRMEFEICAWDLVPVYEVVQRVPGRALQVVREDVCSHTQDVERMRNCNQWRIWDVPAPGLCRMRPGDGCCRD
jgi:hypothetical protein